MAPSPAPDTRRDSPFDGALAESHKAHNRLAVRLVVAVPALFTLVVLGYGFTVLTVIFHFAPQDDWQGAAIWSLGALLVFSLVAVAFGVGLAFSILAPLRAISQALERVAHGAFEAPVVVGGGPELEAVGQSFNSMIHYLNQVFKERNRYLAETDRDAGQGEAMRRLLARTDQLAAMGAFSMGLAHELRNPLGAIKGMAQLLEEGIADDPPNRAFAGKIASEVDRLDSFVRELLEFGQEAPQPAGPCDLAELAAEALQLARYGARDLDEKGLTIESALEPTPTITAQHGRIVRALANIAGNAFDAAPAGAAVRLSTRVESDGPLRRVVAEVANQGAPIPDEDRQRIFEPFFTTKAKGTGLGLAIAYQIVAQNGGELTVACADGWTRFVLAFPLPLVVESAIRI